jgi:polysaccharide export outer membrane protein
LAPGFLLDVQVFDEPELSGTVRVSEHGDINLPLIGSIHVAGETLPQVEAGLVSKFREMKILLQPQVTLNIEQYAGSKITVLGEVQNPGRVDLLTSRSLDDVLSRVGGETITAGNVIQIKRIADGVQHTETIHYVRSEGTDKLRDVMIQPGDTVIVPRAGIVYVLGAVGKPGGYVMQEDGKLDVIQAISLADGTNINAAIGSVRIVRKGPNESLQEIHVPFRDITKGKAAPIQLESEDIVYVPVSKLKTALAASLVTSASSAAIYTR